MSNKSKKSKNLREHLSLMRSDAKNTSFNPKLLQQDIDEQVIDDNFIPLPNKVDYPWSENTGNYGESDILNDGNFGNMSTSYNMCSKSCCSSQWPVPHSITPDDYVLMSNKEFVPTNITCSNGWQDAGCMCVTKEQSNFLRHRGNNANVDL
jgi:hypothetical protein